jgi:hypothetical protein
MKSAAGTGPANQALAIEGGYDYSFVEGAGASASKSRNRKNDVNRYYCSTRLLVPSSSGPTATHRQGQDVQPM